MKKKSLFFIVLLFIALSVKSQCMANYPYWLLGEWVVYADGSKNAFEEWIKLENGDYKAYNYMIVDDKKLVLDEMNLICKDNKLVIETNAMYDSQRVRAGFVLQEKSVNHYLFRNDFADFPNIIFYQKHNEDSLTVRLIGLQTQDSLIMEASLVRFKK